MQCSLEQLRNVRIRIHNISSIGALFEGIRGINKSTVINPQRPYGFLKERQELLLTTLLTLHQLATDYPLFLILIKRKKWVNSYCASKRTTAPSS